MQIRSDGLAEAERMVNELSERGVQIDDEYGLVPLDQTRHLHLARGIVPPEAMPAIDQDARVELLPDLDVGPV